MPIRTSSVVTISIFFVAAALLLNSTSQQAMATLFQFGKSLFSARRTNINEPANTPSFYERSFTDIKGQPLDMDKLRGKVILLVNTASECGYTPQLHTLQELQTKYQDKGFTVLVCLFFLFSFAFLYRVFFFCFRVFHAITLVNKNQVMNHKCVHYMRANSKQLFL